MHIKNRLKSRHVLILLLFASLLVYTIADFKTSHNIVGRIAADRSVVHFALLLILSILCAYYIYTCIFIKIHALSISRFYRFKYYSNITIWLWSIAIWVMFVNIVRDSISWISLVHLGLCFLWILTYHFFKTYLLRFPESMHLIKYFILIMFIFYSFASFYALFSLSSLYYRITQVNVAYNVLVFLPWLALLQNQKLKLSTFTIVFFVVSSSMKRGAILVFPLMIITHLFTSSLMHRKFLKNFFKTLLLFILFIITLYLANMLTDGFLMDRFSKEQISTGSGRAYLYEVSLETILNRSLFDFLIGTGSGSSIEHLGTGVHNEWLEFLYSFGLAGAVLYAAFILSLAHQLYHLIASSSFYAPSYAMALVFMFVVGMYGGIYFVHSTFYLISFYATVDALVCIDISNQSIVNANCSKFTRMVTSK